MFKLVTIGLLLIGLCEAAISSSVQIVVPDDTYSLLTVGKSSTNTLDNSMPSLSNAISEENQSSNALSEESNESAASNTSSQSPAADTTDAPVTTTPSSSSPAAITRVKPLTTLSGILPAAGLSKATLLIPSSAQASAAENSPGNPLNITSPISLLHSTATVQHRILPAETIPLPITISTRPGLRTVIAPETITIQQPGIAKIGEIIQQIPTAVSHQQQTVVHNHARIVTPIVAPAVRTVTSQIVRAYHTPLVYAPHIVEN